MSTIGIRVAPDKIYYTTIGQDGDAVVYGLSIPRALDTPQCLSYIRTNMRDVIDEVGATRAGIRLTESFGKVVGGVGRGQEFRFNVEGVLQEMLAASTVTKMYADTLSQIAGRLSISRAEIDELIANKASFVPAGDCWNKTNKHKRESILVAFAAQQ